MAELLRREERSHVEQRAHLGHCLCCAEPLDDRNFCACCGVVYFITVPDMSGLKWWGVRSEERRQDCAHQQDLRARQS
jgi:hypothetical protein